MLPNKTVRDGHVLMTVQQLIEASGLTAKDLCQGDLIMAIGLLPDTISLQAFFLLHHC